MHVQRKVFHTDRTVNLSASLFTNQMVVDTLSYINLIDHIEEFGKGIVDSRRLIYHLSTTAFFLFLTTRALAAKKWR